MFHTKIAIIDDEAGFILDLKHRLKKYGYENITGFSSSDEFLIKFSDQQFDLILMDIHLKSELDGIEAARRIRENSDIPVIYLTSLIDAETVKRAKTTNPYGYILKPYNETQLFTAIEMALSKYRSDKALRESEKRYRTLVELSPDGIIIHDLRTILYANEAAFRILGAENYGQLIGKSISEVVKSDYLNLADNLINLPDEGFTLRNREEKICCLDGRTIEAELSAVPINHEGRNAIQIIFRDISERNRALEKMRIQSSALEAAANAIVLTDIYGNIIWINPAYTRLTGYQFSEVVGRDTKILKSGVHPEDFYRNLWETILKGNVWEGEIINKRKDGSLFTGEMIITPVTGNSGEVSHFICIMQDITERKGFEKALIESKEKAERSDKLKSEFLAQMSHEIRTPINSILTFSSLLRDEFEDKISRNIDGGIETSFNFIAKASKRIIRTIDQILNMSELQSGTYENRHRELDIYDEVLQTLCNEFAAQAKDKNLELVLNKRTEETRISGDDFTLLQIFRNLIENSVIYTDRGKIEILLKEDIDRKLSISVIDTGIGISPKFIPNLFKPFSQEEQGYTRKYEGNGLGLALVKKYCELNSYDLEVESKKGAGSKFTVRIPLNNHRMH